MKDKEPFRGSEEDLRELRVVTGKQTALERKIWNTVPEKAKDQIKNKMTKGNRVLYECLPHVDFLTFLGKERPGR
jgi:hypothetical protein